MPIKSDCARAEVRPVAYDDYDHTVRSRTVQARAMDAYTVDSLIACQSNGVATGFAVQRSSLISTSYVFFFKKKMPPILCWMG